MHGDQNGDKGKNHLLPSGCWHSNIHSFHSLSLKRATKKHMTVPHLRNLIFLPQSTVIRFTCEALHVSFLDPIQLFIVYHILSKRSRNLLFFFGQLHNSKRKDQVLHMTPGLFLFPWGCFFFFLTKKEYQPLYILSSKIVRQVSTVVTLSGKKEGHRGYL